MTLQTCLEQKRSAYMLKPRGKPYKRYTPDDYANKRKMVVDSDDDPPWRSALRRMRNDEDSDEEDENESEEEVEQEQEPEARRKMPTIRGRAGTSRGPVVQYMRRRK